MRKCSPEATRPSAWLAFRQSVVHFETAGQPYALINTEADRDERREYS